MVDRWFVVTWTLTYFFTRDRRPFKAAAAHVFKVDWQIPCWVYFANEKAWGRYHTDPAAGVSRQYVPTPCGVLSATAARGSGDFADIWLLNVSSAPWRRLCVASRVRDDFKRTI